MVFNVLARTVGVFRAIGSMLSMFFIRRSQGEAVAAALTPSSVQSSTGCGWTRSGSGRNEDNRGLAEPVARNGGAVARDGDDLDGNERVVSDVVDGLHCVSAVPA